MRYDILVSNATAPGEARFLIIFSKGMKKVAMGILTLVYSRKESKHISNFPDYSSRNYYLSCLFFVSFRALSISYLIFIPPFHSLSPPSILGFIKGWGNPLFDFIIFSGTLIVMLIPTVLMITFFVVENCRFGEIRS